MTDQHEAVSRIRAKELNDEARASILFISPAGHRAGCAALLARAGSEEVEAFAAYTNPELFETDFTLARVMEEDGLNLEDVLPLHLGPDLLDYCTHIVTMGQANELAVPEGKHVERWDLTSTDGQSVVTIREIFEDLRWKVKGLLASTK